MRSSFLITALVLAVNPAWAQTVSEIAISSAGKLLAAGSISVTRDFSDPRVVESVLHEITVMSEGDRERLAYALALNSISHIRISNHYSVDETGLSRWSRWLVGSEPEYELTLPASDAGESANTMAQLYPALIARHQIQALLPGVEVEFKLDSRIHFDFDQLARFIVQNNSMIATNLALARVTRLEFSDKTKLFLKRRTTGRTLSVRCSSEITGEFDLQAFAPALLSRDVTN